MNILFSQGDINGIGTEIIFKAFVSLHKMQHCRFIAVGSFPVFKLVNEKLGLRLAVKPIHSLDEADELPKRTLAVLDVSEKKHPTKPSFGKLSAAAGDLSMKAVGVAAALCLGGEAQAMVTAPIHKEAIRKAGWNYEGHTDFLASICGVKKVQMLLCDEVSELRVALASVHVPLAKVAASIRKTGIESHLQLLADALQNEFGIPLPRIAVLGVNPHASDGGVMGDDETEFLIPELTRLKKKYHGTIHLDGLFAADGFFGAKHYENYDAVLAMYHDQGLIPFKMLAFKTGVNMTLGLPIVRTSPDHGTAFDIAGQGTADESSFIAASRLAVKTAGLHLARKAMNDLKIAAGKTKR
jgi:4-hydroxythreonine-4-phosphate dehydrogenase